jgi:hypothetical protein
MRINAYVNHLAPTDYLGQFFTDPGLSGLVFATLIRAIGSNHH